MSDIYQKYFDLAFSTRGNIAVSKNFRGQVSQINKILKNDTTAMISSILGYMVEAGTVEINFDTPNTNMNTALTNWKKNVNMGLNIDIPRGLRSFTEQYMRERWTSSFIVIRIDWEKVDGFTVPKLMYVMDGASIYAQNNDKLLDKTKYSLGKMNDKETNAFKNTENTTYIIRKPGNQWYDLYPTPYLTRKGAIYHALFKNKMLERQAEIINTAFPYQFFIKMGTENMLNKNQRPTKEQMKATLDQFKKIKTDYDEQQLSKGLAGAFPADVKFEELMPDYLKVLDEKILKATDKNILGAMGMIELKGFSQNREESILNPKVLMEEVNDAVLDYTELIEEVVELMKIKNASKYGMGDVSVSPGVIETFVSDNMRNMVRSWYDRGLISQEDSLESTTALNYKTQVIKRKDEKKNNIELLMEPRAIQKLESNDNVPDDKKKGSPESKNYYKASELIMVPMLSTDSIPEDIRKEMNDEEAGKFISAFNEEFNRLTKILEEANTRESKSLEYAWNEVMKFKGGEK